LKFKNKNLYISQHTFSSLIIASNKLIFLLFEISDWLSSWRDSCPMSE